MLLYNNAQIDNLNVTLQEVGIQPGDKIEVELSKNNFL